MSAINSLEKKLDEVFVKNGPVLPAGAKKWLVTYMPWISLIIGVLTLLATLSLWRAGHTVNELVNYANSLSQAYGGGKVATVNHLGIGYWLALITLAVEAVIYIAAFPALREKKKSGWNLLFYALLVNVAYGVFALFADYAGTSNFIGAVIGTVIGGYFLFQLRGSYGKGRAPAAAKKA